MEHSLQLSLAVLKEKGKLRREASVQSEAFGSPLSEQARLRGAVALEVTAEWREERVWLTGKAVGQWELDCCRCLARAVSGFSVKLESVVEEPPPFIDVLEETRQLLVLAVPTQPYCRPDCRGLCVQCGCNRNEKDCGCVAPLPSRFKITKRGKTDA